MMRAAVASFLRFVLGAALLIGVALNFANITGRYVFGAPIIWAEEALIYLLVWCVFLGAPLVSLEGQQIRIDLLVDHLSATPRRVCDAFVGLLSLAVCGFVAVQAWHVTAAMLRMNQRSIAADVPMALPHAAILVGFVGMAIAIVLRWRAR